MKSLVAAISLGILNNEVILDLDYNEDSSAETDLNLVMTESLNVIEIQGTAEQVPFDEKQMDAMLKLADKGIKELIDLQKKTVGF